MTDGRKPAIKHQLVHTLPGARYVKRKVLRETKSSKTAHEKNTGKPAASSPNTMRKVKQSERQIIIPTILFLCMRKLMLIIFKLGLKGGSLYSLG